MISVELSSSTLIRRCEIVLKREKTTYTHTRNAVYLNEGDVNEGSEIVHKVESRQFTEQVRVVRQGCLVVLEFGENFRNFTVY